MNKRLAKKVVLSLLTCSVMVTTNTAWCSDILDGDGNVLWKSFLYGDSGFLRTENNVDGNIIVGDYTEKSFFGGYTDDSVDVANNKVTFNEGHISRIYGGYSSEGNAKNNVVIMNDGIADDGLYGGHSYRGNVESNSLIVNGGGTIGSSFGGYTTFGDAIKNSVVIENCIVDRSVYGGFTVSGTSSYNNVTVNSCEIKGDVYGGHVYSDGVNANNNKVTINGGSVKYNVYGGSGDGCANNNEIIINGGTLKYVYAGYSYGDNAAANNNSVILNGGSGEFVSAGYSGNSANGNKVIINGGEYDRVNGAFALDGNANGNQVIMKNGNIGHIYGASTHTTGNASENTVVITGGTLNGASGGANYGTGNAENNNIYISGGTFEVNSYNNCFIYAGYSSNGSVSNNSIILSGDADVSKAWLCGKNTGLSSVVAGNNNKLIIDGWGGEIENVKDFDEIQLKKVRLTEENKGIVITDPGIDALSNTKITTKDFAVSGGKDIKEDCVLTIIAGDGGNFGIDLNNVEAKDEVSFGISKKAIGEWGLENNNLIYKVNDVKLHEQVLVIGESRSAATAFTNQGSELVETGIDALARDNNKDTKVFAALYGNASEYATGSHVKVNGFSGIVGVGKTNTNGLTIGAFFENGEGNYRTYNVVDGDFMRGDGEANYNGGGLLVRKDNADGVYAEASLRAGNLKNELRNAVRGSEGLAGYDVDTLYYGAHVGVGKVIPRGNEGDSIDVYGKFIYTHHDNEDFTIDGDDFHFDSVNSERLRLGFRINEVQNDKLDMYYGVAWEYEFNGDANNTVVGYELATPSLEGSTVIGELGAHYKANEKWNFDLNARAYVGQRDGFSGSLQANYNF